MLKIIALIKYLEGRGRQQAAGPPREAAQRAGGTVMGANAFARMAAELIAPGAVMRLYKVGVRVQAACHFRVSAASRPRRGVPHRAAVALHNEKLNALHAKRDVLRARLAEVS